jgi:superfamily II DNA or RNA helicase
MQKGRYYKTESESLKAQSNQFPMNSSRSINSRFQSSQMNQPRNRKLLFFDLCSVEGTMSSQGALKASEPEKAGIVDECHHISARSFEIVARQCKAKYVTGLSATVTRKDGHHPIIFMNCGPVRYKVDDKKQASERPFTHKVIVRETNFRMPASFEEDKYTAIHEIYKALLQSDERNRIIVSDVMSAIKNNRFPVILTERVEHLETLKNLLENRITNLIVMKGGMGKKQRKAALDALESLPDDTEKAVLATGRYLGEGFDDERLDTLFLTLPISWRGTLNQYAGRLHRIRDSKKSVVIYDYADKNVPVLARMYDRRVKGYRSIGYEIKDDIS